MERPDGRIRICLTPQKFCGESGEIKNMRGYEIYMTNGTVIPLAQKQSPLFKEVLSKYFWQAGGSDMYQWIVPDILVLLGLLCWFTSRIRKGKGGYLFYYLLFLAGVVLLWGLSVNLTNAIFMKIMQRNQKNFWLLRL